MASWALKEQHMPRSVGTILNSSEHLYLDAKNGAHDWERGGNVLSSYVFLFVGLTTLETWVNFDWLVIKLSI